MQHTAPHPCTRRPSCVSLPGSLGACHHRREISCLTRTGQRQAFAGNTPRLGQARRPSCWRAIGGGSDEDDLGAAFSEELSRRSDAAAQQREQEEVPDSSAFEERAW